MSMQLFEMKQELQAARERKENTSPFDANGKWRDYRNEDERVQHLAAGRKEEALLEKIGEIEAKNTILQFDPVALLDGSLVRKGAAELDEANAGKNVTPDHPKATATKARFGVWMRRAVGNLTGMEAPGSGADAEYNQRGIMEASGVISVGSGTGMESVNFAVPTQILPFMRSYFAFSPFEKAGASIISTDHMRPINLPILSAGAVPATYAEGAGPAGDESGSDPMGLSGFTFGANKRSRQVIATWESLQSTETPLQPMIIDELLTAIANALTSDATTALYNALTTPPNYTIADGALPPLRVGGSAVTADVYGQLTALRHALVEGLEDPTNSFMLSRSTLAVIRNTRASTSGVPMFDPEKDLVLGRPYTVNEYFDSICGAGFVAYGNWNKGAWLRRTPIITRVLQEMYWRTSEIGFIATTWGDQKFLAALVGATNPPTHQPLFYTVLPSGALQ